MAVDGDIKLGLSIDTKDAKTSLKNLAKNISDATSSGNASVKKLEADYKKATIAVEEQAKKVEQLKTKLNELESGSAKIKGTAPLEKQLNATDKKIDETKRKIAELDAYIDTINRDAFKSPDTGEPLLSKSQQSEYDKTIQKINQLEIELDKSEKKANELNTSLKNAMGTGTQIEIDSTKSKIAQANANLESMQAKAQITGEKLKQATSANLFNFEKLSTSVSKFGNRITGLAKRVFIFTLFTMAFRALRTTIGNVLKADNEFMKSLAQLKSALWTAFTPILEFIIPVLKKLVQWITIAINSISKLIATLTGKTFKSMQQSGKLMAQQAKSADGVTKSQKKLKKALSDTNKELKKSIAGFDELDILQNNNADTDLDDFGGGGTTGGDIGSIDNSFKDIEFTITQALANIMKIGGAMIAAIGLILLVTGHPLLGIGCIVSGIALLTTAQEAVISDPTSFIKPGLETTLISIATIVGTALAGIGIILLVFGKPLLGIGCILLSAFTFGATDAVLNDPSGELDLANMLLLIVEGIGLAIAAIGIILLFVPGFTLLGIGMIIAGYEAFKISQQTLDSNGIQSVISEFFENNLNWIVGLSMGMLIIGLMLLLFPKTMLIGFGCIILGVTALKVTEAATGNPVKDLISNFFQENMGLIIGVSSALLVIGILLCFTPSYLLGIGLIATGAIALGSAITINWDKISENINKFFQENMGLMIGVSSALLVIGILLCFTPAYLLGIGLIVAGAGILAEAITINWDKISENINNFFQDNAGLLIGVSIVLLVIGILLLCCGVIPLGLGLIAAGGVILGETIAANWDFIVNKLKDIWAGISKWYKDKVAPWFTIEKWKKLGQNIVDGIKKGITALLDGSLFGAAFDMIKNLLGLGGDDSKKTKPSTRPSPIQSGAKLKVPAMATGRVLPPNKPFLSIVGDQTSGTNVEAPLSTIKQALIEAMAENGTGGNQPIIIELDGREFGRAVLKQGNRESKRATGKLVFG